MINATRRARPGLRLLQQAIAVLAVASLGACVSYSPKPLVREELIRALEFRAELALAPKDSTERVTLARAESIALFCNPSLRAARKQARIPTLSAEQAGRWDDPEFGFDAARILKPEPMQDPWILGSSLDFSIPVSGRLAVERKHAAAEAQVALLEAWQAEQQLLRELRIAWADWESASASSASSRDLLGHFREVVGIADRMASAGELLAAEAVAFKLSLARWELDAADHAAAEKDARLHVVALIGLPPDSPIVFEASSSTPTAIQEASTLLDSNPSVAIRTAEYEAAERQLQLEVRKQFPDITLGPTYGIEDGQEQLGLGVSFLIPILNANRRAIAEASGTRDAARAAWEASVHDALSEFGIARGELEAATARRSTIHSTILPLAETQLREARDLAEQGEINTLLLLEALAGRRDAIFDAIAVDAAIARARAELAALAPSEKADSARILNSSTTDGESK